MPRVVAAPASDGLSVRPVAGRLDLRRFLRLPWRLYRDDPNWVPPLRSEQRLLLDRRRHPFHQHADVEYFLACRGREVVGRIAAILNWRHNEFHGENTGFFGFFESVPDDAVAAGLLHAAEEWLRERGMERVHGPMNFSTNEECALLVDGFDEPPAIMMPYNFPYYEGLLSSAGYVTAKDLYAYLLDDPRVPKRIERLAERIRPAGLTIRQIDGNRLEDDVALIREIYNSAWERNWGFVPMTDAEFDHMAAQLRPILDPRISQLAEVDGEAVGFILGLPDYNYVLRRLNGRLFPFGLIKFLWYRRRIDSIRVLTLGLKPGWRRRGIDALLYLRVFEDGLAAGYRRAECSWVLEENLEMRKALERIGGRAYKTYRIYEREL